MKKILSFLLIYGLLFSGCADRKTIGGIEYDTYGLIDADEKQNPQIRYSVSWGNVFLGVILIETIVVPIYFFGYALFEPEDYKISDDNMKGVVKIHHNKTIDKTIYENK